MDPNTNLKDQRDIIARIDTGEVDSYLFDRLIELTRALDEWLTNGGFLPSSWTVRR